MEQYDEIIAKIQHYCDNHKTMTYSECVDWLAQMAKEAPTQEDLGKAPDGTLIKFEND